MINQMKMKTNNGLSYTRIAMIAVATELILIAIQFMYFRIFKTSHPDSELGFTTEYMKYRGFYIFQIAGFFIYAFLVYMIAEIHYDKIVNKIITLIVAGGIVEVTFYVLVSGAYEGAFLYSILDKIIAAAFGVILNAYTTNKVKKYGSYF